MKKQTMALVLALVMLLGMTPVFAADDVPFTAKTGDAELTEVSVVPAGYTPYAWNGTEMAPAAPVNLYLVTVPEEAAEVELTFTENRLAYNYQDSVNYLAGEYEDNGTVGAAAATVKVDANEDGFADYIQVQTPYDAETWYTEVLYAVAFTREGLKKPLPFADIAGKWFRDAAIYVNEYGLMDGMGDGADQSSFAGNTNAARAVVAEVIWRMAGKPETKLRTGFVDVEAEDPHIAAIDWAAEQGIIKGYGDGRFGPGDPVTRQQLAAMLYRYVKLQGKGFEGTWMLLLDVADRDAISEYAYEPACWLYMNKVMTGKPGNLFDPRGSVTRAELATTLMRLAAVE